MDISLNKNVYKAVQDATKDKVIDQQDIKKIEAAIALDGKLDFQEKKLLEHLENFSNRYISTEKVNLSVPGSSEAVIQLDLFIDEQVPEFTSNDPNRIVAKINHDLTFSDFKVGDVAYDKESETIQKLPTGAPEGETITYGKDYKAVLGPVIEGYKTQADAIRAIRGLQTYSVDANDYAIQKTGKNNYVIRPINTINATIGDDIDGKEINDVKIGKHLVGKVVAIVADSGEVKHYGPLPKWPPSSMMKTTSDVLKRLQSMETILADRGDHRAVFPAVYKATTEKSEYVLKAIKDPNHKEHEKYKDLDPKLIENIVMEFGKMYFDAFDAYEKGDLSKVPVAWQIAFNEAKTETTTIAEDMLLGINAHIGNDLAMILNQKLPDGNALYDPSNEKQCNTFYAFNQILIDETPTILFNVNMLEQKLGGITAFGMSGIKILGESILGTADVESKTKKLFTLARSDAESNAALMAAGKATKQQVELNIGQRSAILAQIPNTGRAIN